MVDIRDALYIPGFGFDLSKTKDQSLGSPEADFAAMMKEAEAARQARKSAEEGFSRQELTQEEIEALAAKYDPKSMTQEEYDALLDELVEKSVLKKSEMSCLGYGSMVVLGHVDPGSFHDLESWRRSVASVATAVRSNPLSVDRRSLEDYEGNALEMVKSGALWRPAVDSDDFLAKRYEANTALLDIMRAIIIAKAAAEEKELKL